MADRGERARRARSKNQDFATCESGQEIEDFERPPPARARRVASYYNGCPSMAAVMVLFQASSMAFGSMPVSTSLFDL